MRNILTTLLILVWGIHAGAQSKADHQVYDIHKAVLKSVSSGEGKYRVAKLTKKTGFRNFDFRSPDGLDTSASNVWKKPGWKPFLDAVDTTAIGNYPLADGDKAWFRSAGKQQPSVVFAPVIISGNGAMAVSILTLRDKTGKPSTSRIYFLEKEGAGWRIKQDRVLALID